MHVCLCESDVGVYGSHKKELDSPRAGVTGGCKSLYIGTKK